MNFETWQKLWQEPAQGPADAAAISATIEHVRTEARRFERTIFWRDAREVVAAVLVSSVFGYVAWAKAAEGAPAGDAMIAAAIPLGVVVFLLIDRQRAKRRRPAGGTVTAELDRAIAELRHQHGLLRHVAWWYLLPLAVSAGLVVGPAVWAASSLWWVRLTLVGLMLAILAAFNLPIYRLNRRIAAQELWPRIVELERRRREFAEDGRTE